MPTEPSTSNLFIYLTTSPVAYSKLPGQNYQRQDIESGCWSGGFPECFFFPLCPAYDILIKNIPEKIIIMPSRAQSVVAIKLSANLLIYFEKQAERFNDGLDVLTLMANN